MTIIAPRTMTMAGLQFLQALAAQRASGCFLEIGPLFGSSTNAIHGGRRDRCVPIHTIDTFEPAPWVSKRLGKDLSRQAFESYTSHIDALHIHEGFAPDVVRKTWQHPIGFYFDDATHGDPGWSDNYDFFSPFFTDDAIICGDDFAGGWPDIVRNVYRITEELGVTLFVVGRVWAFTCTGDARIAAAVDTAFPRLKGLEFEVTHAGKTHRNLAASWSWGLHKRLPLTQVALHAGVPFECSIAVQQHSGAQTRVDLAQDPLILKDAKSLEFDLPPGISLQFCVMTGSGKTENTKDFRSGTKLTLQDGAKITALRLSHR